MRVQAVQRPYLSAVFRMLVFIACCSSCGVSQAIGSDFRAQVLVDVDVNSQTGCLTETGQLGGELRLIALSNRSEIAETRVETCHEGHWRLELRDDNRQPVIFGQGVLGSDSLRWSVPRAFFGDRSQVSLSFALERMDPRIIDRLEVSDASLTLALPGAQPTIAIPTFGWGVSGLLVAGLMLLAWRIGRPGATGGFSSLMVATCALLALVAVAATPVDVFAVPDSAQSVSAVDAANDVSDAAVDIVAVQSRALEERVEFQIDVNNIEDDGLASPARVLFIGNSLTSSNDLPAMLVAVAQQAGKQLSADSIALPNTALEDHFRARTAHTALASGQYQFVIMQQGPSSLPESRVILLRGARALEPLIRAGGARPAFYMVWPDLSRIEYFDDVRESYSQAADAVNGMFIPAGQAWLTAWSFDVGLPLYSTDDFHPSRIGSYLAALSMFCELYRQSPIDLPPRLSISGGQALNLDADLARTLQTAAWMTHLTHGRAGQ